MTKVYIIVIFKVVFVLTAASLAKQFIMFNCEV